MMNDLASLADIETRARSAMSAMAYEYIAGGAADELTLRWNIDAFARIRLRPRVLTDVSRIDPSVSLLGTRLPLPLLLAPAAYHRLVHAEGEVATARGAAAAGVPYIVSTCTTTPLEDIARAAPDGVRWLQVYVTADRVRTGDLVQLAEAVGMRALCLTVDTPVSGTRNREQRIGFHLPPECVTPYFRHVDGPAGPATPFVSVTWRDVEWLRGATRLPVLLKGILTAEDATIAADAGVAGIVVSNHGARNIDTVPASIEALPEVVDAVRGRMPILVDGGIRRGTDILKALALGATATMIGRSYLYGLTLGGAQGVEHVVRTLRAEFESALALTGRASATALDPSILWDRTP